MEKGIILSDRSQFVDIIKGFAILLMLWGHCIQYCYPENKDFFLDIAFKTIYSFHMPLLMLVSGYLFYISAQRYEIDRLLYSKVLSIAKPIIGGSIFVYLFTTVLFAAFRGKWLRMLLDGKWLSALPNLWFLWSVLAATIVMCIVVRYGKNRVAEVLILILGIGFVMLFPNWQENLYMYPYFVIGFYYAKYKNGIDKKIKYISFIVFPIMLMFFERKHYIYTSGLYSGEYSKVEYFFIDSFRWMIGLIGSIFAVSMIQILLKYRIMRILGKTIAKLGQKTLQIYVLSVVFLSNYLPIGLRIIRSNSTIDLIYRVCVSNSIVYDLLFTFSITVLYAFALMVTVRILERSKVSKFIFGR